MHAELHHPPPFLNPAHIAQMSLPFMTQIGQVTLRSYLGMLRMVDQLRSQKSYRRASAILVKAYLRLHDVRPKGGGADGGGLPDMTNMSAAEKKKIKAKVRSVIALWAKGEFRGEGGSVCSWVHL